MRKIDLTPIKLNEAEYPMKETIIGCLFHPDMKLGVRDIIPMDKLAQKIEGAKGYVLLEESEYEKVSRAIEIQRGWQRGDIEFVSRILDAPQADVKEV